MESLWAITMLVGAASINTAGSALMKYATLYKTHAGSKPGFFILLMFAAMAAYGGCFPLYAAGLGKLKLSVAQPVFSATGFVLTAVIAVLIFQEKLVPLQLAGIAVIVGGIALVAIAR